jgi:protein SCO1
MSDTFKQRDHERWFLGVAISVALVFGTGFCLLIIALNRREQPKIATGSMAIAPEQPRQLINFSFTDRTGRPVTRAELAGKFLVVNFLFTSCSLTCPIVSSNMTQIQQLTINEPDVRLVSLTVDPRTDTVPVLAKFGARFGAEPNRWFLLTGDKAELHALIATSFLAQDLDDPFTYMPGNFSHTERIAVVDSRGNVRAYFDGLNATTPAAVAAEIARLKTEKL